MQTKQQQQQPKDYKVHRVRFVDFTPKTINAVAFHHDQDSSKLAVARGDGSIEIRDPASNWLVDFVIPGHDKRSVEHLAWCEGRLFSGSVSGHIIEWDLQKLQPKYHQDSYGGPVWCLKFSYSKKVLATGCEDGGIHLFDVYKDSIMYKGCLNKQESRILCLAWTHDDKYIFTGGFDCTMHKWDVDTGHIVSRMATENLKEGNTMIWSLEVLRDMTIVIGNSIGHTQFWDGNMCTLLQSFKSHLADVLAVAVDAAGQSVYSTGIDSAVTEFKLVQQEGGYPTWMKTRFVRASKHDVRALCICGPYNCLVSGGIDPRLIVHSLSPFAMHTVTRHSCLPRIDACHLARAANMLCFREQHSLHVWKLTPSATDAPPNKIFEIKSSKSDHLVCSAISSDGRYAAYSNINKGQLFELSNDDAPVVRKCAVPIPPSTYMAFTSTTNQLVTIGHHHNNINVVNVKEQTATSAITTIPFPKKINATLPFKFLRISKCDSYVCVVDSLSNVFVFSLTGGKFLTTLPCLQESVLNCVFSMKKTSNLLVMTSQRHLFEFNIETEKFEQWCLDLNTSGIISSFFQHFYKNKSDRNDNTNVVINPTSPEEIFIQEPGVFGKILHDCEISTKLKEEEEDEEDAMTVSTTTKNTSHFRTNDRYNGIMFFDFNDSGEVVIVEQPIEKILGGLPAPLKRKTFGS